MALSFGSSVIDCAIAWRYPVNSIGTLGQLMSMHMVGPWLNTNRQGKNKKTKFKSAAAKAQYLAERAAWADTLKKHGVDPDQPKKASQPAQPYRPQWTARSAAPIEDNKQGIVPGVGAKPEPKVYTGDRLIGIAVMHKSNLVPVFRREDAEEIANMRRG